MYIFNLNELGIVNFMTEQGIKRRITYFIDKTIYLECLLAYMTMNFGDQYFKNNELKDQRNIAIQFRLTEHNMRNHVYRELNAQNVLYYALRSILIIMSIKSKEKYICILV